MTFRSELSRKVAASEAFHDLQPEKQFEIATIIATAKSESDVPAWVLKLLNLELFPLAQENAARSRWYVKGAGEPVGWFTTDTGKHVPMYAGDTYHDALYRSLGKDSPDMPQGKYMLVGTQRRFIPKPIQQHLTQKEWNKKEKEKAAIEKARIEKLRASGEKIVTVKDAIAVAKSGEKIHVLVDTDRDEKDITVPMMGDKSEWKDSFGYWLARDALEYSDEHSPVVVATDGKEIFGAVNYEIESPDVVYIHGLGSSGKVRGTGADLIRKVIEVAPDRDVVLNAVSTQHTMDFYTKKVGMTQVAYHLGHSPGGLNLMVLPAYKAKLFLQKGYEAFKNVDDDYDEPCALAERCDIEIMRAAYKEYRKSQKQTNTIQDDIADMFNEENPEGTYQRTMKDINKAVQQLGDDIFAALKKE